MGAIVARDVRSGRPGQLPLLRAGVAVSERYRDVLIREGIHAVYVEDELGAGIEVETLLSEEVREEVTERVSNAFERLGPSEIERGADNRAYRELAQAVHAILKELSTVGDGALALNELAAADAYTFRHSVNVCALGLLLGRRIFQRYGWVDFRGKRRSDRVGDRLTQLGLGLLLHDVGKLTVPATILHKPDELDPEEWEVMRGHPDAGVDLLRSDLIGPLAKVVVRSHHERWDGSGYPNGLRGQEIHQFARIAGVADVFDAIVSERVYAPAQPQHLGWNEIVDGGGALFDPEVVAAFRVLVAPYPPGSEIRLADGRRGVVVSCPAGRPDRPRVRVGFDADGAPLPFEEISTLDAPELLPEPLQRTLVV